MKKNLMRLAAAASAVIIAAGAAAVPAAAGTRSDRELTSQSMNSYYMLPDSDTYYITEADISWMDDEELMLARNEFYARRGRKFVLKSIREYFEGQGWYHGTIEPEDFSPDLFNRYEQANVDFIVAYENKRLQQRAQKKKEEVVVLESFGPSEQEEEYYGIVSAYGDSIEEDWSDEEMEAYGINSMTGDLGDGSSVGYMYRDLDGDGNDELLIGSTNPQDYGEGAVFEIYTIEDGVPVEAVSSDGSTMYYVCGDGTIRQETVYDDGRWAIACYDLDDGDFVCKELLVMDESRNEKEPWYVIDKDSEIWEDAYGLITGLDWIPDSALKHISGKEASELRASFVSEKLEMQSLK